MQNLNLILNKTVYAHIGQPDATQHAGMATKQIVDTRFCRDDYQPCPIPGVRIQLMQVGYPGLVMGLGYTHVKLKAPNDREDKNMPSQADMGFSFDYVTGQPYLPGSSVKGMLRSVFVYPEVIREILGKDDSFDVDALESSIFDDGDVFFAAVVRHGGPGGRLIAYDNITPHADELRTPEPHTMLRVVPGAVMEFRFLLRDSEQCTADEKLKLFTALLRDFGIGAKTNVGYGVLTPISEGRDKHYCEDHHVYPDPPQSVPAPGQAQTAANAAPSAANPANPANPLAQLAQLAPGTLVRAKVTALQSSAAAVSLPDYPGVTGRIQVSQVSAKRVQNITSVLRQGQAVKAKVLKASFDRGAVVVELSMRDVPQNR